MPPSGWISIRFSTRFLLFMSMKKILATVLAVTMLTLSVVAQSTNNPNTLKVRWDASPDAAAVGYSLYYRLASVTNFSVTNIVGRTTTNAAVPCVPYALYELYVTAKDANNLESDASNKIRAQNILVNGFGKVTPITVLDPTPGNLPQFVLTSGPTNGVATGTLPTLTYNPTNTFGKDMLVFKTPDVFSSQNVTSYVSVYRALANSPTITVQP